MATPAADPSGACPVAAALLARIVADEALMAAIPPDAARKMEDELRRRDEEAEAGRIQAEKDNVVKGERIGRGVRDKGPWLAERWANVPLPFHRASSYICMQLVGTE